MIIWATNKNTSTSDGAVAGSSNGRVVDGGRKRILERLDEQIPHIASEPSPTRSRFDGRILGIINAHSTGRFGTALSNPLLVDGPVDGPIDDFLDGGVFDGFDAILGKCGVDDGVGRERSFFARRI